MDTYICAHLLVCLCTHTLTPRAPHTLQILTGLLPGHPTTYLTNFLCGDDRSALHPALPTYEPTHVLAYFLTYITTYMPTCYMPATTYLRRREQHAFTSTYLHDCVVINLLTHDWLTPWATPTFTFPCDIAYLLINLLPTLPADANTRP